MSKAFVVYILREAWEADTDWGYGLELKSTIFCKDEADLENTLNGLNTKFCRVAQLTWLEVEKKMTIKYPPAMRSDLKL